MNECVNILMEKDGKTGTYGYSEEADALAKRILDKLTECVESYESRYCDVTNHRFSLHAQVGISEDYSISPGVRIAIGDELPLHEHLIHCSQFHPYFKSGVGDIFPFDETAKRNPEALLDMIKGGFEMGMRYFSTYGDDADVIRITGYLVKKSDIAKLDAGVAVQQANAMWGLGEVKNSRIYERKVRSLEE
jgi:YjjI family glycine radical enzyme